MAILSKIISFIICILVLPITAIGYLAHWFWAICFFGWARAEKHMDFIIDISDKRKEPHDR